MVVIKVTKILEIISTNDSSPVAVEVLNIGHILPVKEDISHCEELRVVKNSVNRPNELGYESVVTIESLTYGVDSSSGSEGFPEPCRYFDDGINSDSIESIFVNQEVNPFVHFLLNVGIFSIQIS